MTDNINMHYGSFIPEEFVTTWVRDISEYELLYDKKMFARTHLPYRDIGESNDYDMSTYFNSDDGLAQVIAKGSVPDAFTVGARTKKHEMFCIADGFVVNSRDLLKPDGATMKTQSVNIAMNKIHGKEDSLAINGDTSLDPNFIGVVGAARANEYGSVTAAASSGVNTGNCGAWDGSDTARDLYEDTVNAIDKMEQGAEPYGMLGNKHSLRWLNVINAVTERPFTEDIAPLFNKGEKDRSWMIQSQYVPDGYVFIIPKDPQAAEFVVSSEIQIKDDYAEMHGGNMWLEIKEFVNPCELHQPAFFAQIQIT